MAKAKKSKKSKKAKKAKKAVDGEEEIREEIVEEGRQEVGEESRRRSPPRSQPRRPRKKSAKKARPRRRKPAKKSRCRKKAARSLPPPEAAPAPEACAGSRAGSRRSQLRHPAPEPAPRPAAGPYSPEPFAPGRGVLGFRRRRPAASGLHSRREHGTRSKGRSVRRCGLFRVTRRSGESGLAAVSIRSAPDAGASGAVFCRFQNVARTDTEAAQNCCRNATPADNISSKRPERLKSRQMLDFFASLPERARSRLQSR